MIKADVTYDKKAMLSFMRFTAIDKPWKLAIYGALFVFAVVLTILNLKTDFLPFAIIVLFFVSLIEIFTIFAYFISPNMKLKNFTDENIIKNHFSFEEKSVKLKSESKARKSDGEIPYYAFVKVDESSLAFYLFVNKTSALIITKSEITEGTPEELKKFLIAKIPDKRINKLSVK